ncbi:MAG: inner membrane-spanning protein YciB [Lutimaribacter sp.]
MAEKEINPLVKTGLELGPVLAFFAGYLVLNVGTFSIGGRDYSGFILVTAGFIPVMIASTAALWALTGKLAKMQVITLVLVVVFGGLSVWLNDDRFFKMKPTIIYLLLGGILGFGLLRGQSYLRHLMEEMMPLQPEGWMKLTRRLCFFFFGLALLNEVIWRSMSTENWVWFKTFGLTAAIFLFFLTQGDIFRKYGQRDDS